MNEGTAVAKELLLDLFEPDEGSVNFYYGRIGNGKTYSATADILNFLSKGRVVYANWHINFSGFDERKSFWHVFYKFLFLRKRFFRFPKENLHYFSPDDVDIKFLSKLTDCEVFVDEGQWVFDSYKGTDFSIEKRKLILHTRHFNRSLNIISQRTQALHVTARGQVNRFFKCEKKMIWPFLIFKRTEFQDMKENDVDEESDPISEKTYFAKKSVLDAYNSKYMRGGVEKSQEVYFDAFDFSFVGRMKLLFSFARLPALRLATRKKSLGVKSSSATIKKWERLKTIPLGGSISNEMKESTDVLPF